MTAEAGAVPVLHHRHRLVVAVEVDPGEGLIAQAVHLQNQRGEKLARVALGLRGERLALEVGERVDLGVGERHDLEVLRIQVRELADLRDLLGVGRPALQAVDRGAGVGEADLRLALVYAAHVRDPRAGSLRDLQPRHALLPHALERAAERDPRAALRAGHEGDLLRCRGRRQHCHGRRDDGLLKFHSILLEKKRF
jgi:hypothetical protein